MGDHQMNKTRRTALATIAALALTLPAGALTGSADATAPHTFANCTALNKVFHHGVGKPNAHDHTSGTPVRNFKKSLAWYNKNSGSDRDKDGIACEKA